MADTTTPMAQVDHAWLRMDEPTNLMVVTGVLVLDRPVTPEQVRALVRDRLLRFPRFAERVVRSEEPGEGPAWQRQPTVNLDDHVKVVDLGSRVPAHALERLVSALMSEPLDPARPLWQFHLVPRYKRGSALVSRLHHCIGDGLALIHVLLSMADGTALPGPGAARPAGPNPWDSLASFLSTLLEAGVNLPARVIEEAGGLARDPARAASIAGAVAAGLGALGKLALMEPDPPTPLKGPLVVEKRVAWSRPLALADLKAIARATGATVNDVLVCAVAGALRRYVLARGAAVDRDLSVRAVMPVNLRPLEEAHHLGNEFGLVFLPLPLGAEEPLDRLFEVRSRMDAIKRSPEAHLTFQILRAIGVAPQPIFDQAVSVFEKKASCVMTNVVGPMEPMHFAGALVREAMFWVPCAGRLALGLSVLSYAGHVRLGAVSDAQVIPEPQQILDAFVEEVRGLRRRLGALRV